MPITSVTRTSETDARMTVAQRLPASRDTVENKAEAKASPNPKSASKNLIHTSGEVDCSHCATRLEVEESDRSGLVRAEPTEFEPSILGQNGQSGTACRKSDRNHR